MVEHTACGGHGREGLLRWVHAAGLFETSWSITGSSLMNVEQSRQYMRDRTGDGLEGRSSISESESDTS